MQKEGVVESIGSGGRVLVKILPVCEEHSGCSHCGLCGNSSSNADEAVDIEVESIAGVIVGSKVMLSVSQPKRSIIALFIYFMPLVLMFLGGGVGNHLGGSLGMLFGGGLGFAISLICIYILNKTVLAMSAKIIELL